MSEAKLGACQGSVAEGDKEDFNASACPVLRTGTCGNAEMRSSYAILYIAKNRKRNSNLKL
jgi:hypothetical protein